MATEAPASETLRGGESPARRFDPRSTTPFVNKSVSEATRRAYGRALKEFFQFAMEHAGNGRRGSPHSERAGEAMLDTGTRAALYRALRELSCSRCGGVIRGGELFTREAEPASGLPLVRVCRGCAPFSDGGGLLDALLAPGGGEESRPTAAPGDAREKVMSRLGPALAASRRRR